MTEALSFVSIELLNNGRRPACDLVSSSVDLIKCLDNIRSHPQYARSRP